MFIRVGNYQTAVNEAALITRKKPMTAPSGLQYGVKETWNIMGFLQAPDQNSLLPLMLALEAAFAKNYQTIQLIGNDGVTVLRYMRGETKIGGVIVTDGVSYPESGASDAEFSTFRRYNVTVEGTYESIPGNVLIAWDETLMLNGGNPRWVMRQPLNAKPVRQQVAVQTPYKASQRGSATYLMSSGPAASPLFPAALHQDTATEIRKSPKRSGGSQALILWEYGVDWSYDFESAFPLGGYPTSWPR